MKHAGKLALMSLGLAIVIFGVTTISKRGGNSPQRLSIPAGSESISTPRVSNQPRILQAKPIVGASPQYRDQQSAVDPAEFATETGSSDPLDTPTETTGEYPQVPNALADELLESAVLLPTNSVHGWPDEVDVPTDTWTTEANDSLWEISLSRYDTGEYYHALFELNRTKIQRPDQIRAGLTLETPAATVLRERFPHLCPAPDAGFATPVAAQDNGGDIRR